MTSPRKQQPMVLPNYPYLNKFSAQQISEALDRKDRIVETLMDPVGPDGTFINIPVDMMHILAFHQAFAGVDVHTDQRQLIESRTRVDESQMFEVYEWRPKGEFGDAPSQSAQPDTEAAGIAAQMRQQLTPELRAAVAAILLDEYSTATNDAISPRERANNVVLEQREMRSNMKEGKP